MYILLHLFEDMKLFFLVLLFQFNLEQIIVLIIDYVTVLLNMISSYGLELWFLCSFWVGKGGFVTHISLSKDFALVQQAPRFSNLKPDLTLTIWDFSPVFISYYQHNLKISVVHSNKHFFCSQVCGVALIQTAGLWSAGAVPGVFIVEPRLREKQPSRGSSSHDKGKSTTGQDPLCKHFKPLLI